MSRHPVSPRMSPAPIVLGEPARVSRHHVALAPCLVALAVPVLPQRAADGRWTEDAWAPTDGFVVNGGVRIRF